MESLLFSILILLVSMALLYYGAEWLVKGASRLALTLGIPPLVIGLTVVSFGTSAPELLSSLAAVLLHGSGSIAIGNVLGSNIVNIGWILGLSALITPLVIHSDIIRREAPINILVIVLLVGLMWNGTLSRLEGWILLGTFAGYLILQLYLAKKKGGVDRYAQELTAEVTQEKVIGNWRHGLLIVAGIVALGFGARWLVDQAVFIARLAGLSERVIGLTIVAIGTSLPELATTVVAALKKETDLAVGNIIGSNIFNVLLVVGAASSLASLQFDPALLQFDIWFLLGLTTVMLFFLMTQRKLVRWEGGLLLLASLGYTAHLFLR